MARRKDPVSELRRGALELALLAFLDAEPCFGGGILGGLAEATNGGLELTEGSLYPALHRLEKRGVLSSEWREDADATRPRKYYSLTEAGRERLLALTAAWRSLSDGLAGLLEESE
jgi:PadR family transcriptional regulator PadR